LEREVAQAIVDATHGETRAYSNATRGTSTSRSTWRRQDL
jgi:hypothetical protein